MTNGTHGDSYGPGRRSAQIERPARGRVAGQHRCVSPQRSIGDQAVGRPGRRASPTLRCPGDQPTSSTLWRVNSRRQVVGSTRSARPDMSPTRQWRSRPGRTIPRCCITGRVRSMWPARGRSASVNPVRDVLQSLMGSADEPIAGGRHKVFGHQGPVGDSADVDDRVAPAARCGVGDRDPPSPSARGCQPHGRRMRLWCARFGDASVNHSTATGADQHRDQYGLPRDPGTRSSSSARTTAGASRYRRRAAGSRRRTAHAPACTTRTPTVPTRRHVCPRRTRGDRDRAQRRGRRCSCICVRCASSAMREAMPRSGIASRPTSSPTMRTTRSSRPPPHWWSVAWPPWPRCLRGMTNSDRVVDDELVTTRPGATVVIGCGGDGATVTAYAGSGRTDGRSATPRRTARQPATLAESINATLSQILMIERAGARVR